MSSLPPPYKQIMCHRILLFTMMNPFNRIVQDEQMDIQISYWN